MPMPYDWQEVGLIGVCEYECCSGSLLLPTTQEKLRSIRVARQAYCIIKDMMFLSGQLIFLSLRLKGHSTLPIRSMKSHTKLPTQKYTRCGEIMICEEIAEIAQIL